MDHTAVDRWHHPANRAGSRVALLVEGRPITIIAIGAVAALLLALGPSALQPLIDRHRNHSPNKRDSSRERPDEVPSGYLGHVSELVPEGGLVDREAELAELSEFSDGDDTYIWWQAGPWAGKSALLATFATNPPADADIIAFFVNGRLASQADSAAFENALIDQLSKLLGGSTEASELLLSREIRRRELLAAAIARCEERGRRLILVVDGLDEDRGAGPGTGIASIAALLPYRSQSGLRVVVSSRTSYRLPDDVLPSHPLRSCQFRTLRPSPHAADSAHLARRELTELLSGDQRQQELIGLTSAAGGGLTIEDLEELTGFEGYALERLLNGNFARTIVPRSNPSGGLSTESYVFAHEALRVEAGQRLGQTVLSAYRGRIHKWCDHHREAEWSTTTSAYLLHEYPRLLRDTGDVQRLVQIACDATRHDRGLAVTGGDNWAFEEVLAAEDMVLADERSVDLKASAALAQALRTCRPQH